ncbi:hypothetical protein [Cryptosporangium sp. NPDC048952]|uniref:hypothetical protein n=1 Tax=Cryptosporangium sp. NPDC048952 TaxID=3363961 RepID=UPI00370FE28F
MLLEGGDPRSTDELSEPVQEPGGVRRGTEAFQIHRQAGGVVDSIERPQIVVELQAVQSSGAVVQAEDVVGEQVAVAVAHPAGRDPGGEEVTSAIDVVQCPLGDLVQHRRVSDPVAEARQAGEVVHPALPEGSGRTSQVDDR